MFLVVSMVVVTLYFFCSIIFAQFLFTVLLGVFVASLVVVVLSFVALLSLYHFYLLSY